MKKIKIINIGIGAIMGIISFFIDVHLLSLLLSIVVAFIINTRRTNSKEKISWDKIEENGFWYFFIALFIVWTILYNIRLYTIKPILPNS